MLALAILLVVRWRAENPLSAPPAVADPDQPVEAFACEHTTASGTLVARLAPLHADAGRQRFESEALRARLALEAGAPWRLSLSWEAEPDAPAVELAGIRVVDDRGDALRTLELAPAPGDPVRTLLAAPRGPLAPGASTQCVLWGREPGSGARIAGVGDSDLTLQTHALKRSELNLPLARVHRETGKNPGGSASDPSHANRD